MATILLMVLTFAGYLVAYHTYGRFLARKIFQLRTDAVAPSQELQDGIDYVPTRRGIIFGHHYTSIAGTGPIVGPAIGIIWGWVPALLWVFVGSIVMGAVHDFGAVVLSMRNRGQSISECAARYLGVRIRYIFFLVVFLINPRGMGMGDIKLAGLIGLVTGFPLVLVALFIGIVIGGLVAIVLLILRKKGRKDFIPYGVFLGIGPIVVLLWGNEILSWYLGFF